MYKIKISIEKQDTAKAITTNSKVVTNLDLNGVLLSAEEYAEVKTLVEKTAELFKSQH